MEKPTKRHLSPKNRWFLGAAVVVLFGGALILAAYIGTSETPLFCKSIFDSSSTTRALARDSKAAELQLNRALARDSKAAELQLNAIVHYATSRIVPQQSLSEIRVSLDVLKTQSPCNFLVFGLGHDSLMWASLNAGGTTLFLEEDPKWVQTVLNDAPYLRAHTVNYRTKLAEADELLNLYQSEPDCWARASFIRENKKCKLALNMLPEEVYNKEWDLIMIDAPRGYFPEAPGRMAAIYSAAVMARNRKGSGVTHVFLHDVDRKVEKVYAETFLCGKNLVKSVGRLWHFEIKPTRDSNERFC